MSNHIFVNGKEFRPISAEHMPNFESSEKIESTILGGEATFSFKPDKSYEKFVEQMKNELSTVDIIDWPAQMI